jgi:hypothetical protein
MKRDMVNSLAKGAAALACSLLYLSTAFAACEPLVPNLRALAASDIHIVLDAAAEPIELRFAATNWNSGWGRLEVVAKSVDTSAKKQRVDQRIYDTCGGFKDYNAGSFAWHENHNHFHFDDFANYFLTPLGTAGQGRNGTKTTFCIMDTTIINSQIWGASSQLYSTCGNAVQGMSVGWGDTYGSYLSGQSIDATGLLPGLLRFAGSPYATSFNILQRRSGRCGAPLEEVTITSITPNQVRPGWSGTVTIVGTGFDPVMPVSISSGSDSANVSSVAFLDSTTIQATVKVPKKKRLRDPDMDVRVGPGSSYAGTATLPNAFRIVAP